MYRLRPHGHRPRRGGRHRETRLSAPVVARAARTSAPRHHDHILSSSGTKGSQPACSAPRAYDSSRGKNEIRYFVRTKTMKMTSERPRHRQEERLNMGGRARAADPHPPSFKFALRFLGGGGLHGNPCVWRSPPACNVLLHRVARVPRRGRGGPSGPVIWVERREKGGLVVSQPYARVKGKGTGRRRCSGLWDIGEHSRRC